MNRVVAFGASTSASSINHQLALYAAGELQNAEITPLNLNDFEMPIFGIDREKAEGIPKKAHEFKDHMRSADGIIISLTEHNGSFSAAFKNIFDWASRIEKSMWLDQPMFLLATSPGARGAQSVLGHAVRDFPFRGGRVIASFSLPSFQKNFTTSEGINDADLLHTFREQLVLFQNSLKTA